MYKKLFFFVFFSLLFLTVAKNNIYAQEQSLSIYPPVIEVQTTPPSSPTVPLIIQSNIEDDVTLKIQLVPFKKDIFLKIFKRLSNFSKKKTFSKRIKKLKQSF
jgi:hypothetical protein